MAQTVENVLSFLETRLATINDLRGKVKVTKENEPYPGVIKDYGARLYLGESPKEVVRKKIGNVIHEIWHINTDLIINRSLKTREFFSDAKGISYWEHLITSTLLHQTNGGAFVNSWWEFSRLEELADSIILKGMYHCEVLNRY